MKPMYVVIVCDGITMTYAGMFDDYVEAIAHCKKIKRANITIFIQRMELYNR